MRITMEVQARVAAQEELIRRGLVALPGQVVVTLPDGENIPMNHATFEAAVAGGFERGPDGVYREAQPLVDVSGMVPPSIDIPESEPDTEPDAEPLDVSEYHLGAGWYELPDGRKVRGEDAARAALADTEPEG